MMTPRPGHILKTISLSKANSRFRAFFPKASGWWQRDKSTGAMPLNVTTPKSVPKLVNVPALPLLGSVNLTWYSGTPEMDQKKIYEFWPEMRRRFGDFYSFGLFGVGKGLSGVAHVIQDPDVIAALLRSEGKFPFGAAEFAWPIRKFLGDRGNPVVHFFSHGPQWRTLRNFIQSDLLSPEAAAKKLPAIVKAASMSAKGAPMYSSDVNQFCLHAGFDVFSGVMIGHFPRIADPTHQQKDPLDVELCDHVCFALRLNQELTISAYHAISSEVFGIKTAKYREFENHWDVAMGVATKKTESLWQRSEAELSHFEKESYAISAKKRAGQPDSEVSMESAQMIVGGLLSAAVDTTVGTFSWKLLHVALSPEAQERIYQEQVSFARTTGGPVEITPDSILPANAPYLHACIRESHRLATPNVTIPMKKFENSVTVHGVELPPGSIVMLDAYSTGVDPTIVGEDYLDFKPERFLEPAVLARKGTRSAIMDHLFFSGPFSQGARRCPGSRVANHEIAALLAAMVVEWEMKVVPDSIKHWTQVEYELMTVTAPKLPEIKFTPRQTKSGAI